MLSPVSRGFKKHSSPGAALEGSFQSIFWKPCFKSLCFGNSILKTYLRTVSEKAGLVLSHRQHLPASFPGDGHERQGGWVRKPASGGFNLLLSVPSEGTDHRPVNHIMPYLNIFPRHDIQTAPSLQTTRRAIIKSPSIPEPLHGDSQGPQN